MTPATSIFSEYYRPQTLVDRFSVDPQHALTVIIPVIHTNELWEANLHSIYREIPVAELIISDGGCIDDSIAIAQRFPRVRILDHRSLNSLGFSIRQMIHEVKTPWFAYLHSDVYLPPGWFDKMHPHQKDYDWYGCRMQHTVMVEYDLDYGPRPYAGAQIGRREVFLPHLQRIDDDYVYRQEDFVFADIVQRGGGKEGRIDDVFHYHQTMHKQSPTGRKVKHLKITMEMSDAESKRTAEHQLKGIVKYLSPDIPWAVETAITCFDQLVSQKTFRRSDLEGWIRLTSPDWISVIKRGERKRSLRRRLSSVGTWLKRRLPL